jgi:23S rRNA (uridine2552-2'-O)-methyltransferase
LKRPAQKKNRWEDHLSRQAKKDHYPARSVYKLKEIQDKFRIIRKGNKILDLGCAPGSWLLFAAEKTGASGQIVGIDIKPVSTRIPGHARIVQADVLSLGDNDLDGIGRHFDVVLSDMAPATTGRKEVDAARSFYLCQAALEIARHLLNAGGSFVCKIFQGEDSKHFSDVVSETFRQTKTFKPQSSRKPSKEIYVIGLGKK